MPSILSQLFPFIPFGRRNVTPPSVADGELGELQVTATNLLKVSVEDAPGIAGATLPTGSDRGRVAANHVVVAAAATLVEAWGTNESAGDRWIWFFNRTTAPSEASVAIDIFRVPAGGTFSIAPIGGWAFATGLTWGVSTSASSYAEAGGTDARVTVTYKA